METENIKFINILFNGIMYHLPNAVSIDRKIMVGYGMNTWWIYHDLIDDLNIIYSKGSYIT